MYFTVTVKLEFTDDNGKKKKQTEKYLVDAVSVTDAEVKVTEEFEGATYDWSVKSVAETKIVKVLA